MSAWLHEWMSEWLHECMSAGRPHTQRARPLELRSLGARDARPPRQRHDAKGKAANGGRASCRVV